MVSETMFEIFYSQGNLEKTCVKNFVPADGPALLGAKPSAATAMAKIVVYKIWQAVPSMIERSLLMRANICIMMTSSNGNIFRVTGHLCGEFTGPRWIPRTKAMTRSFDVFFDLRPNKRPSKQWWGWWFETPSNPLWRHCNVETAAWAGDSLTVIPWWARSSSSLNVYSWSMGNSIFVLYSDISVAIYCTFSIW